MKRFVYIFLLGLFVLPRSAAAGSLPGSAIEHVVQKGDTLELLAAEYYGDRRHTVFIIAANPKNKTKKLRPGSKLSIPISRQITTEVGDTIESLSEKYLGDKRRTRFLAEFNQLDPSDTLGAGQPFLIPFHVIHKLTKKQTLDDVALLYFGDKNQAAFLIEYNFLDETSAQSAGSIVVPIHHVRVRASRLPPIDKKSKERAEKRREMEEKARKLLPQAKSAWHAGDFAAVKRDLTQIDLDYLSTRLAVQIGVLLGSTYVAFDDEDSARAVFRIVRERSPKHKLKRYDYSPKILQVWDSATEEP